MPGRRDHNRRLLTFARRMRKEPTEAERKMWLLVRDGRIGRFHFRRQVPIAGFIADFCCLAQKLIIEVDGGQHRDEGAVEYDDRRTSEFEKLGLRVIRFPADKVLKWPDHIREIIYEELTNPPPPQPSPGVPGEGVRLDRVSHDFSEDDDS